MAVGRCAPWPAPPAGLAHAAATPSHCPCLPPCSFQSVQGDFAPSDLLCPKNKCWVPLERASAALDAQARTRTPAAAAAELDACPSQHTTPLIPHPLILPPPLLPARSPLAWCPSRSCRGRWRGWGLPIWWTLRPAPPPARPARCAGQPAAAATLVPPVRPPTSPKCHLFASHPVPAAHSRGGGGAAAAAEPARRRHAAWHHAWVSGRGRFCTCRPPVRCRAPASWGLPDTLLAALPPAPRPAGGCSSQACCAVAARR